MPALRFRKASPRDDAFFLEVEIETTWCNLHPEDRERLSRRQVHDALVHTHDLLLQRPGNEVIVAEDEQGKRVGLLWYGVNRNLVSGADEAWIYNVTILEAHRGKGYGRLLIEHAESLAKAGGFRVLGLMVANHNHRAQKLYEAAGFHPTNVLMRKPIP